MPGWDGVDSGVVVDEAGSVVVMDRDAVVAVLSVEVEVRGAVDNEEVDVLVEDEEVEGWSWKEMYREDLEFQVAVVTGRAGGASNKADWSLQQTRSRKQQCVVLLSFPLRQGVTTIPWRSTVQKLGHSGDNQFLSVQEPRLILPSIPIHSLFDRHPPPDEKRPQQTLTSASGSQGASSSDSPPPG